MKVDNPEEAVDEFLGLPPMEQDKSEWYDGRSSGTIVSSY
jgi:hypothetical protein